MPDDDYPAVMTATQARRYLGAGTPGQRLTIGVRTFRRWADAGYLPSWTDPNTGRRLFTRAALDEWAKNPQGVAS